MARVPVATGIFTDSETNPELIGAKCADCGIITFPTQDSCPRCASTAMESHHLARTGTLWAWTTQQFQPPSPPYSGPVGRDFVPYAVGYITLGNEIKVEARLTESDPSRLHIGMPMELVIIPFNIDSDDNEVTTFAFRPAN